VQKDKETRKSNKKKPESSSLEGFSGVHNLSTSSGLDTPTSKEARKREEPPLHPVSTGGSSFL
jgi:hypothetical protein